MKTVGAYECDEKDGIGRGAFGVVYKGRNKTKLHEVVAIKEVVLNSSNDSTTTEIEILKALSNEGHKNIVTLFHSEKQTHHVYFVMEFCNGGSLKEYLKSKQKLDERTIITFLQQIAAGLNFAHDIHIIHRDLKPDNILLCFSGPKYPSPDNITLKIADFGIGRFLHSDEMASTNCGSLPYMAPEILIHRPGGYDYKVDLWSVGVIAYECLVGSLPSSSIALNGFQIPMNATLDFVNLLRGLLENDEKKRFTLKHFLDHKFFGKTIGVAVSGPSGETTMIQVKENQSVDHLLDLISAAYKIKVKDFYLMHDGFLLEGGSGKSLRESGIAHYSSVFLNTEVRAGLVMDRPTPHRCSGQNKCPKCKGQRMCGNKQLG